MSANTWYIISLVGYFAAVIGLIVTVVLYFRLNILDVIGDLSGRTVARELKSMRENRNTKGVRYSPAMKKAARSSPGASKTAKSGRMSKRPGGMKTTGGLKKTGGLKTANVYQSPVSRKPKNGTAQMGVQSDVQPDKMVLHTKTDKLNRETERLYEDFDPRVEYSYTERLEEKQSEKPVNKGTAVLHPGTEVLPAETRKGTEVLVHKGTDILEARGTEVLREGTVLLRENGTCLLTEETVEPVKFSITRSYLVVHSEESIIEK